MKIRLFLALVCVLLLTGCGKERMPEPQKYGVFIGSDKELSNYKDYETIVIDAQYYTAEQIKEFKGDSHKVYSYINVGSVEDFRDYYADYEDLTLGDYEHWAGEKWVDVSNVEWQEFVLNELAPSLAEKGIDGFFVDNCDVYYVYPKPEILSGLSNIMRGLRSTGRDVIINGGDAFLEAYTAEFGNPLDVVTGINQESVFSGIDWDDGTFTEASEEDQEYFTDYIEKYSK
ncbi:MAG: endo alpha-1,4 polygalactosaminidase, partial [Lachnospiraceae bacterium]|nr:endo alpha-1,4 polygalactosaminidase [Lachnospiraceae bacterium]